VFARKGKARKRDGVICNVAVMLPKGAAVGNGHTRGTDLVY